MDRLSSLTAFAVALLFLVPLYILRNTILPLLITPAPPPSQTTLNTTLNAGKSSTSGRRRGLRHRVYDSDDEREEDGPTVPDGPYRLLSKPIPESIKPCLKPRHIGIGVASFRDRLASAEMVSTSSGDETVPLATDGGRSDSPAGSEGVDSDGNYAGRRVRLVEPESKASLIALRELWGGENSRGGIAGYRRTREIYTKGQGGTAVIKKKLPPPPVLVVPPSSGSDSLAVPSPSPSGAATSGSDSDTPPARKRSPAPRGPHAPQTPLRSSSLTRQRSRSSAGSSPIRGSSPLSRSRSSSPSVRSTTPPHSTSPTSSTFPPNPSSQQSLNPPLRRGSLIRSASPLSGPSHPPPLPPTVAATPKWIKSKPSPPSPLDQRQHVEGESDDEENDSDFEDMSEGALTPRTEQDEEDDAWGWGRAPMDEAAEAPLTPVMGDRMFVDAGRTPKRSMSMSRFGGSPMECKANGVVLPV